MNVICIATMLVALAQAPGHKGELTDVKATGCTVRVAATGCLFLKTLDGKTTYNIVSVDPVPNSGIVIIMEAKPHQGPATCKQGISVDVIQWESTGETCAR